jgi:creatinine amidohydrolase
MYLKNATWHEIDDLDRDAIVIVPFAAMEQHGPHLPFETDTRIAEEIVRRIEARMPSDVLLLPVHWAGYSPHHMDFAGSITLTAETFLRVAVEVAGSIAKAGFRRFLLLNSHGGNRALLDVAAVELKVLYPQAAFVSATYWNIARRELEALRESAEGGMGHACELETSIMLSVSPETVLLQLAAADGSWPCSEYFAHDMLGGAQAGLAFSFSELTRSGVNGDPTTASAAKGERFLSAIVDRLTELVRRYRSGELHAYNQVGCKAADDKSSVRR